MTTPGGGAVRAAALLARAALPALALLAALGPAPAAARIIFSLRDGAAELTQAELVGQLREARVVFFGERHDSTADHVAQRTVLQALHDAGVAVAVGLEMFRTDSQPQLDRWVARALDERELRAAYDRDWAPRLWDLYADIFYYARQEGIPLVGLNVPREIVAQVARGGFGSLSPEQRRRLGVSSCDIPERYEGLLRVVLGEKAAGAGTFRNFCEAQLTWDAAMAGSIAAWLDANPGRTLVVLCGTFHAWRHGIPARLRQLTDAPSLVILPSSDENFLNYDIVLEDADYVWWQR